MAELNTSSSQGARLQTSNRRSTRVDLTPMVDLGFLLITFFVFTTALTEPKAMDLIERKDSDNSLTKESGAMTILLSDDNSVYYYEGMLTRANSNKLRETDFKNVRSQIVYKKRLTNPKDLMILIKADSTASFGNVMNIIDEMAICQIPGKHFAEADLSDLEIQLIKEKKSNR